MELTQILRRCAASRPDEPALISGDLVLNWREFHDRTARLAGALVALGVARGDRVAMLAENSHRYLEFYFGAPWAGAIFVPLNHRLAAPELAAILQDAGCELLIVDDTHFALGERVAGLVPKLPLLIFAGDGPAPTGTVSYEEILAAAEPLEDQRPSGSDVAGIFYTGGTTGLPKGVMHTHDNLWMSGLTFACHVGLREGSRTLCSGPLFHVAAMAGAIPAMIVGGALVILPRFDPATFLDAIQRHRVEIFNIVPTMTRMLLDHPKAAMTDWSSIKTVVFGSSAMAPSLLDEARQLIRGADFRHGYGMTEVTGCLTMTPPGYFDRAATRATQMSAGPPIIAADVMVLDPDGWPCEPGKIGEICGRGPVVMKGYWGNPAATDQALRNGWFHTGDAGYLDQDGHLFVVDRLKDMIKTGGENVYSAEVEAAIYSYGGVSQCAVIGLPDEKWGEVVHAIVVPAAGVALDTAAIQHHCRELIAGYKCPRSIEIRTEPLPLSGANKIQKTELRARLTAS